MIRSFWLGAVTAAAIGGAAHATVATSAWVGDTASDGFYAQGYNLKYDTGTGYRVPGLFGATTQQAPCGGCVISRMGTMTQGAGATSSFDQATLTVAAGAPSNAYGRANLHTGKLGVRAAGTTYNIGGYNYSARAEALAALGDGLNFTVAGASAGTITNIGVTLALHGSLTLDAFLQEQLSFRSAGFADAQFINQIASTPYAAPHFQYTNASGWVSFDFTPYTPGNVVFHGVYALTGASQHVDIGEVLLANSSGGVSDYAHTSDLTLSLPHGVSFTSDSGAFLTGSVPEPATWALLVAGFAVTGMAARRRDRVAA